MTVVALNCGRLGRWVLQFFHTRREFRKFRSPGTKGTSIWTLCAKLLIFDGGFFVTAVEMHLALLLLATVFRSSVGVRVLGRCLFAVKLLGFALGVYSGYSSGIHFSTLTDACSKDRIRFSSVSRS